MNKLQSLKLKKIIKEELQKVLKENTQTPSQIVQMLSTADKDTKPWKMELSKLLVIMFKKYTGVEDMSIKDKDKVLNSLWSIHTANEV